MGAWENRGTKRPRALVIVKREQVNLGVSAAGTTQSLLKIWVTDKVFQALNWTVDFPYMMGKVQSNLPGCAELGTALEEVMSN